MNIATWFWVLMVISLLFGVFGMWNRTTPTPNPWAPWAFSLLLWVLLGLLGWGIFGAAVHR